MDLLVIGIIVVIIAIIILALIYRGTDKPKTNNPSTTQYNPNIKEIDLIVGNVFADHLQMYESVKDYAHIGKLVDYGRGIVYAQIAGKETIERHWTAIRKHDPRTVSALIKMTGDFLCRLEVNGINSNVVAGVIARSLTNIVTPRSVIDDVIQERQVNEAEMTALLQDNFWLVYLYLVARSRGIYSFFAEYSKRVEGNGDDTESTTN